MSKIVAASVAIVADTVNKSMLVTLPRNVMPIFRELIAANNYNLIIS